MGDRCSVEIVCRKHDAKHFDEIGFVEAEWGDEPEHLARMFCEQANYGASTELEVLAGKGIVFIGASGVGDEYPAGVFASDGKGYAEAVTVSDGIEAKPIAEIGDGGSADSKTLALIKRYYETLKAAKKALGLPARQARRKRK